MEKSNLIGAVTAVVFLLSAMLVFIFRLLGKAEYGRALGVLELLLALPLIYLLIKGSAESRPALYYIQVGAVLLWLLVELLLDYVFKLDFRQVRWMVITYVVLFFAACGGLVGIASNSGKTWSIASIVLFLITAVLTFVQRKVTGM